MVLNAWYVSPPVWCKQKVLTASGNLRSNTAPNPLQPHADLSHLSCLTTSLQFRVPCHLEVYLPDCVRDNRTSFISMQCKRLPQGSIVSLTRPRSRLAVPCSHQYCGRAGTDAVIAREYSQGLCRDVRSKDGRGFPQAMDPMQIPGSSGEYVGDVFAKSEKWLGTPPVPDVGKCTSREAEILGWQSHICEHIYDLTA